MTTHEQLALVASIAAFAAGATLRLVGCLAGPLAQRVALPAPAVGRLLSACGLAVVLGTAISGVLVDHLGSQHVLIVAALIVALGWGALALARTSQACAYGALLLGVGHAGLAMAALVLGPHALFASSEAASANLVFALFVLGAVLTPAPADLLVGTIGLRRSCWVAAALSLIPGMLAIWIPADAFPLDRAVVLGWDLLGSPVWWGAALTCLFYGAVEGSLGAWGPGYLAEAGCSTNRCRVATWSFWLAFLGSRLVTAYLQQREILPRGSESWVLCVLGILAVVALGNLTGTHRPANAAAGLVIVGILLGPILPTLAALLFREFPGAAGTALGSAYALGAAGSLLLPPVFAAAARRGPLRRAMLAPTLTAILLVGGVIVLVLE